MNIPLVNKINVKLENHSSQEGNSRVLGSFILNCIKEDQNKEKRGGGDFGFCTLSFVKPILWNLMRRSLQGHFHDNLDSMVVRCELSIFLIFISESIV